MHVFVSVRVDLQRLRSSQRNAARSSTKCATPSIKGADTKP